MGNNVLITGSGIVSMGAGSDLKRSQLVFATLFSSGAANLVVQRQVALQISASATFYNLYLNNSVSTSPITGSGQFWCDSSACLMQVSASNVTGSINLYYEHVF